MRRLELDPDNEFDAAVMRIGNRKANAFLLPRLAGLLALVFALGYLLGRG